MSATGNQPTLENIISLCKRRGFIYPSSEIYGGLNGVYDTGPLGTLMKENIRETWKNWLNKLDLEIVFLEGAILAPEAVWKASGHIEHFQDPLIDCLTCKHRFRADEIDKTQPCPNCGKKTWTDVRQFNLMFKTQVGASEDKSAITYLRPETAQSIFVNFKNVISTTRIKIPFGIAQIGKAFRNEITPKQFLFRIREFDQMELEWFCRSENAEEYFSFWSKERHSYYKSLGIKSDNIRLREHKKDELAHYSTQTTDIEYHFPFGWKELEGIANRGNFDLSQHSKHSGKDLSFFDEQTNKSFIPYVIECSVGIERLFLALLFDAYHEEIIEKEKRIVLKLSKKIAPYIAAFLPLSSQLIEPMQKIYLNLKKLGFNIQFDTTGSIGKRYRRQDEIGTPYCFTYDFESEKDNSITVRNRDTMKQIRIPIDSVENYLNDISKSNNF